MTKIEKTVIGVIAFIALASLFGGVGSWVLLSKLL